ncbi:hypothetical protein AB4K20DRAFT_1966996 [Rhizopus microsporus]
MAVRFDKEIQEQTKRNDLIKINFQTTGVFSATDCLTDSANDLTFSGTDNGLVNLSTNMYFISQRFQFHIQLCNRYHVLQEPNIDIKDKETAFLNFPQSKTINANEIDINYMHRKNRKHLERLMKKTFQEEVSTLEAKLEKASFSASNNVEEFQQNYRGNGDCLKKLRSFYNNYEASRSRKKKYLDKITAEERKFLTKANAGADKKQMLMFIGDRGTGVGSRIKGFRRYGGGWKEQLHEALPSKGYVDKEE